jgi:eukaryotic-like serine/threonine-protein kinase
VVHQPETLELTSGDEPLVLDRYRLVRRLGSGGFGVVWLAHDERLDRAVAVKRIPLEGGENPRAEREALAAARLSHPGIVALYEAGNDDEAWWLVSELVRGRSLAELERDGALSDLDVVRIGAALCAALEHAHSRGVIHRDVKPGNVMVADDGAAKLTDFGIARLADATGALTHTGDVVGTLAYMAPEQAEGRRVTPAADLYALALVLYEALSGTNPIRAEGAAATARRVGMVLPPLRRQRRDLPRELCEAIDAAVDPDPDLRGTPADLREALLDAEAVVADEPGYVTAQTSKLGGLLERTRQWRGSDPHDDDVGSDPYDDDVGSDPFLDPRGSDPVGGRRGSDPLEPPNGAVAAGLPAERRGRPRTTLLGRAFAAASAGGLATWALTELDVDLSLGGAVSAPEPAAVAGVVAVGVALLPRLGWLLALLGLLILLGPERATLIVLAAALPVVVLVPRHGALWSLPAAAPALGALGLAGAYPALAGQARTLIARVGLGALGLWWLGLGAVITDDRPDLGALVDPGTLALAGLWGAAAGVLPLIVRGRNAAIDALAAAGWAAALATATPAIAQALDAAEPANSGAAAALGAGFAVAAAALRGGSGAHTS